jgi:5-methylcytosine-specific restriction endonuclease McrA
MDPALRAYDWERAGRFCEYCQLHQADFDFLSFHVEHIIARQHGGSDDTDNLCLACSECVPCV